jgi:hypothetical protein
MFENVGNTKIMICVVVWQMTFTRRWQATDATDRSLTADAPSHVLIARGSSTSLT